jgi:hypothetical protein
MGNLVVSSVCNMRCPYCFARDYLEAAGSTDRQSFLSLDDYEFRLDFLDRSGIDEVRLIGGEPTLHPQFPALIERARKRGKKLVVFTNGVINPAALECLAALPEDGVTVLVNANATGAPGLSATQIYERRKNGLKTLGKRATLGYTIFEANFQCDFLLPLMEESGIKKSIRLGLAQPAIQGSNQSPHPRQYPFAGKRIAAFASRASQYGIRIEFDCGFVPCMFSQAEMELLSSAQSYAEWRCNPVLDIDLNGEVSHCFPLAGRFRGRLDSSICAAELRESLSRQAQPFGRTGIYQDCMSCAVYQRGECTAVCQALAMKQFERANFSITIRR